MSDICLDCGAYWECEHQLVDRGTYVPADGPSYRALHEPRSISDASMLQALGPARRALVVRQFPSPPLTMGAHHTYPLRPGVAPIRLNHRSIAEWELIVTAAQSAHETAPSLRDALISINSSLSEVYSTFKEIATQIDNAFNRMFDGIAGDIDSLADALREFASIAHVDYTGDASPVYHHRHALLCQQEQGSPVVIEKCARGPPSAIGRPPQHITQMARAGLIRAMRRGPRGWFVQPGRFCTLTRRS